MAVVHKGPGSRRVPAFRGSRDRTRGTGSCHVPSSPSSDIERVPVIPRLHPNQHGKRQGPALGGARGTACGTSDAGPVSLLRSPMPPPSGLRVIRKEAGAQAMEGPADTRLNLWTPNAGVQVQMRGPWRSGARQRCLFHVLGDFQGPKVLIPVGAPGQAVLREPTARSDQVSTLILRMKAATMNYFTDSPCCYQWFY